MTGILKIAITGPESSGKSDLSEALAKYFKTSFAREYAREFLEKTGGVYNYSDLSLIAQGQLQNEELAIERANGVCFFDTDMLVLKVWAQFRFNKVPDLVESAFEKKRYDHYLLCKPDIGWEADAFRESPNQNERDILFEIYKDELDEMGASYHVISGRGEARINSAVAFVKSLY